MSDYHSAAREFCKSLGHYSEVDLVPLLLNAHPTPSEVLRAKTTFFIREIRSPGSRQYQAYGSVRPIRQNYGVFETAIGMRNGVVREQIRKFEQADDRLSLVRIHGHKQNSIEILPPTAEDIRSLMVWRKKRETEAALLVHRGERFDELDVEPHLKIYLGEQLRGLLAQSRQVLQEIDLGNLSEKDLHVHAELNWHIDCQIHKRIMEAAGMSIDESVIGLLREKMRLTGSFHDVVLGRAESSQQEHEEIVDATLSGYSLAENSEQRIIDVYEKHIGESMVTLLQLLDDEELSD